MKEIKSVTVTRIPKSEDRGSRWVTGNMVAALVTHEASRALNPYPYSHICAMNVTTYDPEEQHLRHYKRITFTSTSSFLGEVSYNKLPQRMTDAGYEIEEARKSDLKQGFSRRITKAIQ